jgi:hypothetical protein
MEFHKAPPPDPLQRGRMIFVEEEFLQMKISDSAFE